MGNPDDFEDAIVTEPYGMGHDREDSLRVTALELAIKYRPADHPDDVIRIAERFRAFLAGPDAVDHAESVADVAGYRASGFVERIDMGDGASSRVGYPDPRRPAQMGIGWPYTADDIRPPVRKCL